MSPTDAPVAPWVEPYLPDFRALLRVIERSPGFVLQPVVLPSPDLARALADWLTTQNVTLRAIDLRHGAWDDLAARLASVSFGDAPRPRAVVVITPHDLDPAAIDRGLAALNSQRDMLARHLGCPLLWCGSTDLLRATADHASDFWSIANPPHRIPPRDLSEVPQHMGDPRVWWTNAIAVADASSATPDPSDRESVLRAELQRIEATLVRGDHAEALDRIVAIEDTIHREFPALSLRLASLTEAAIASVKDRMNLESTLRRDIKAAHVRRALHVEAARRRRLAQLLRHTDPNAALEELRQARAILLRAGDDLETLKIESLMTGRGLRGLSAAEVAETIDHAKQVLARSSDPELRQFAQVVCAQGMFRQQRLDEALAHARDAYESACAHEDLLGQFTVLQLLADITETRGSWNAVVPIQSAILALAERLVQRPAAIDARIERGRALAHCERYPDALDDFKAAARLGQTAGDWARVAVIWRLTGSLYASLGNEAAGAALLMRSILESLRRDRPSEALSMTALNDIVRPWAPDFADALDALGAAIRDYESDPESPEARQRLRAVEHTLSELSAARERELSARGIDIMDPATWPPVSTPLDADPQPPAASPEDVTPAPSDSPT